MNLYDWWYSIVDSWFSVTITIGIVVLIGSFVYSIIKTIFGKGTSE